MKKTVFLILTVIMLMSAAACTSGKKDGSSATATDLTQEQLQEIIDQCAEEKDG